MLLGDLLNQLEDEAVAAETILHVGDLALIARMRGKAEAAGLTLGAYASHLARTYANNDSDAEWLTLIGQMGRADNPGAVYLERAFVRGMDQS